MWVEHKGHTLMLDVIGTKEGFLAFIALALPLSSDAISHFIVHPVKPSQN